MNSVFIYALNDPDTGRARYIGQAHDPYRRYEEHLASRNRERTHKANWIRSLLKRAAAPVLEILDEVPQAEWAFWEREYIRLYRALMFDLTNGNAGGVGGGQPTAATRAKKRAAVLGERNPFFGRRHSEETKEKNRLAHVGRWVSKETRLKQSLTRTGRPVSFETRARMSKSKKGRQVSDETKAKLRAAHLGKIHSPEARAKISAAGSGEKNHNFGKITPIAVRAKISASLVGRPRGYRAPEGRP